MTTTIREALEVLGRTIDHKPGIRDEALADLDTLEAQNARLRAACKAALRIEHLTARACEISGHGTADEERTTGKIATITDQLRAALEKP